MARADVTGVSNTCPMINEVQNYINYIMRNYSDQMDSEELKDGKAMIDTLESIRDSNSELREFGTRMYEEREEFENEVSERDSKISEMESELAELRNKVNSLEEENEELENRVEHFRTLSY